MKHLIIALLFLPMISFGQNPKIKDYKITILSTMLSDSHIGEWGFSAMIGNIVEDIIPEDQSLFFDTEDGIVLISGCSHAGLANILDYVQKIIPGRPIYKIIGGFHLLKLSNDKLEWTAGKMREAGVNYFVGAHCTGLNSTYSIRNFLGLTSERALVGSVGTVITAKGIFPGYME